MQGDNPSASGSFVECCPGLTTCEGVSASEIDEFRFEMLRIAQLQRVLSCSMTIKEPLARDGQPRIGTCYLASLGNSKFGDVQGHVMMR